MIKGLEEIHAVLKANRYPVSKSSLMHEFNVSESTVKRVFKKLREFYGAPLDYSYEYKGYAYSDDKFELNAPGLWVSPETLLALVSLQKLLAQMQLDLLDTHLNKLKKEIAQHLKQKKISTNQIDRIRILPITARISNTKHFQQVASALLQRKSLNISYHARGDNQVSVRVISPQRLAHYKDNWYLDAWCHMRNQLRTFALDRIQSIENDKQHCQDIEEEILNQYLASGYGIFAGQAKQTATLLFSANRARWVADETWHPKQQSTWLADGRYQLQIPYADERELLMDIMRHLPEVEVLAPPTLKQKLAEILNQSLQQHQNNK